MKVYKVDLMIIDYNGDIERLGNDKQEIKTILENSCIDPTVIKIESKEIGEWDDDHPINCIDTQNETYNQLFNNKNGV